MNETQTATQTPKARRRRTPTVDAMKDQAVFNVALLDKAAADPDTARDETGNSFTIVADGVKIQYTRRLSGWRASVDVTVDGEKWIVNADATRTVTDFWQTAERKLFASKEAVRSKKGQAIAARLAALLPNGAGN